MSTQFPCPNASCGYMFDAAQLPAAAMVTCPYCSTKFPWKNGRILAMPPQAAPAPAPAPVEVGDDSFDEPASEPSRYSSRPNRLVNPTRKPTSGTGRTLVIVTVFSLVLAGLLFSLLGMRKGGSFVGKPGQSRPAGPQVLDSINASYDLPAGWVDDPTLRSANKLLATVLRRGSDQVWIAMQGQDFEDREPRPSELYEMLMVRFKRTFESPEFENPKGTDATFAGLKAREYRFKAVLEDLAVSGTAWTASNKGIGYLFMAWSDDAKAGLDAKAIADLKGRFKVLKNRDNWKPKLTNEATFVPEPDGAYQVTDREGVWVSRIKSQIRDASKVKQVLDAATEEDPAAGIALLGNYPKVNRDRVVNAKAIVIAIPKKGSALETAKQYLEAKLHKEAEDTMTAKPTLEPASVSPSGDDPKSAGPAPVEKLQMRTEGAGADKIFYAISAIDIGEKDGTAMVAAVIAESPWKNAVLMESYMVNLAGSLSKK